MIVEAAVNVDGRIYRGRRHGAAIHAAVEGGEKTPILNRTQGFVTDKGEFLFRKEARDHAVACDQIPFDKEREGKPLISEELW